MSVTRLMHFITLKTANSTAICRTWFTWCLICIRPTKQSHTVLTFFLRNWLGTWNDLTRQLIIGGTAFHYMPVLQFWLDYSACRCRRLTFIADDSRFILLIFIYVIVFFWYVSRILAHTAGSMMERETLHICSGSVRRRWNGMESARHVVRAHQCTTSTKLNIMWTFFASRTN